MPDPAVWEDIRVAYETTSETVTEIAARFGIHRTTITRHANENGWTLRPSGADGLLIIHARRAAGLSPVSVAKPKSRRQTKTAKLRAPATTQPPAPMVPAKRRQPKKSSGSETHQLALVRRLYEVTDAKLSVIEQRIASGTPLKPADAEREAREIAAILKTIEKLKDLLDAFARTAAKSGEPKPGDTGSARAFADDAERLRQDLAERFARLKDGDANTTPAL